MSWSPSLYITKCVFLSVVITWIRHIIPWRSTLHQVVHTASVPCTSRRPRATYQRRHPLVAFSEFYWEKTVESVASWFCDWSGWNSQEKLLTFYVGAWQDGCGSLQSWKPSPLLSSLCDLSLPLRTSKFLSCVPSQVDIHIWVTFYLVCQLLLFFCFFIIPQYLM